MEFLVLDSLNDSSEMIFVGSMLILFSRALLLHLNV